MASVLFLEAAALGTLFALANTDSRLRATEYQKRTLAVLAVIYYVAATFAVIYAMVT